MCETHEVVCLTLYCEPELHLAWSRLAKRSNSALSVSLVREGGPVNSLHVRGDCALCIDATVMYVGKAASCWNEAMWPWLASEDGQRVDQTLSNLHCVSERNSAPKLEESCPCHCHDYE